MADGYLTEVTVWDGNGKRALRRRSGGDRPATRSSARGGRCHQRGHVQFRLRNPAGGHRATIPGWSRLRRGLRPAGCAGLPRLAFEAYYDYARVDQAANSLLLQLVPLVLAPLLVLQLIQSPIPASLARRVRRHEAERSVLLERTLSVSDRERVRVAADLHDGPIQDLAGVTYVLDAVSPSVLEAHRPLMRDAQNTVTHAINSLRRLMVDLYPPDLSAEQLPGTISSLADPLRERGVEVTVSVEPMVGLGNETVTTLYRVARESLANVVAHAQASRVDIRLGEVECRRPRRRPDGAARHRRQRCRGRLRPAGSPVRGASRPAAADRSGGKPGWDPHGGGRTGRRHGGDRDSAGRGPPASSATTTMTDAVVDG